jgi:hypothetical protein
MERTISDNEFTRLPSVEEASLATKFQKGIQSLFMGAPIALDDDRIVTSVDWADGSLTVAAQPDVPRNITAVLTDADTSVTGLLTITGTDIRGRTITETMQPDGAGAGKTLTGTKIFAKVTSAVISGTAGAEAGVDLIKIGVGNVIGTPNDLDSDATVHHVYLGGVRQASPTVVTGVSTSGINASAGTYNGSKMLHAFLQLSSAE